MSLRIVKVISYAVRSRDGTDHEGPEMKSLGLLVLSLALPVMTFAVKLTTLDEVTGQCGSAFQCKSGQECVIMSKICNGEVDCHDASDEDVAVCPFACADKPCGNGTCAPTPYGGLCSCDKGFEVDSETGACADVDECASGDLISFVFCQYECRNTAGSYSCECPEGRVPRGSEIGDLCLSQDYEVRNDEWFALVRAGRAINLIDSGMRKKLEVVAGSEVLHMELDPKSNRALVLLEGEEFIHQLDLDQDVLGLTRTNLRAHDAQTFSFDGARLYLGVGDDLISCLQNECLRKKFEHVLWGDLTISDGYGRVMKIQADPNGPEIAVIFENRVISIDGSLSVLRERYILESQQVAIDFQAGQIYNVDDVLAYSRWMDLWTAPQKSSDMFDDRLRRFRSQDLGKLVLRGIAVDENTGLVWRLATNPPTLIAFNPQSAQIATKQLGGFGPTLLDAEDVGTGYEVIINPRAGLTFTRTQDAANREHEKRDEPRIMVCAEGYEAIGDEVCARVIYKVSETGTLVAACLVLLANLVGLVVWRIQEWRSNKARKGDKSLLIK